MKEDTRYAGRKYVGAVSLKFRVVKWIVSCEKSDIRNDNGIVAEVLQ
jgi:hypothetical protein